VATVRLANLTKEYAGGGVKAVNALSLEIADGEFLVLVGPSGCGKSTALKMIAGLEDATSGEVWIGGDMVNDYAPRDRDIAMVFQSYALYPHMSVFDNIAFALQIAKRPKKEIAEKVAEVARILQLENYLDRRPGNLSGGQRQRVAMGRAIIRQPAVFLMDEPLSNLDAKLRVQMRSEIKRFHQDLEATVIYVTHDQLEAVTMADKMAVMSGGVLQQYDSPANVFANPANVFVAGFVGSPAMSLVPLEVSTRGDAVFLVSSAGWSLPLSPENARKALKAKSGKVILGARHSTIRLHKASQPDSIPGRVYTAEPAGDVTYAHVNIGGPVVTVSVEPQVRVDADEPVWLELDQQRVHLFDGETEMALAA
jgi:multiple sugar transport system ATP-binding protein